MRRIIALVSLGVLAVAVPVLAGESSTTSDQPLAKLPYTPSLDVTAMDRSVDPCVDFYTYSCGGWEQNNPIPPDQSRWSVYGKLHSENQQYLWGLLQRAAQGGTERSPVEQKIGDYFAACMDEQAIDAGGLTPIRADLDAIDQLTSKPQVPALLARLHLESGGGGLMFGFGSDQDPDDSEQVIAYAYAGGLGLPDRDYYVKDDPKSIETRGRYLGHVARMLELLGKSPVQAATDAAVVMRIETALASASLTRVERRNPHNLVHKMNPTELSALTPGFDWTAYLSALGLADAAIVNVTQPKFYQALDSELQSEPLAVWKAYLQWHLLDAWAPYLSRSFADADFAFYRGYLRGVEQQQPRWKRCVRWVDRDLGEALGQVFVQTTFSPETRDQTRTMVAQIEADMGKRIQALEWMSPATKEAAEDKLEHIRNKVGYPDKWRDYSSVDVQPNDFAGDVRRAALFESHRQLAKIGKPVDRGEWGMTPPTVNAYYNPAMNDINFPAGVLQPLYDPKLDDAPNYGNTGSTIGHELTHAFDDEGRQFDAQGNLRDWWTDQDAKEFKRRAQCVVDQYAQYLVVDDIHINSKLTLGEDIADLGGTILAYDAWKAETEGKKLEDREGLTPEQRFFVGFAQWACSNQRPESLRLNALTNPHSPAKYRINGVVVNMPEFARAFQCTADQPMVKKDEDVCRIW
jgi:putative endopeptidase